MTLLWCLYKCNFKFLIVCRFYSRDSGLLKFRIYAGFLGRSAPPSARRLVAFIFHPTDPFAISVQRTNADYVVNFHIRKVWPLFYCIIALFLCAFTLGMCIVFVNMYLCSKTHLFVIMCLPVVSSTQNYYTQMNEVFLILDFILKSLPDCIAAVNSFYHCPPK